LRFLNLFDTGNLTGGSNMTEMTERKIEAFWKNATADDVARVMNDETVEARFRDEADQAWGDCLTLIGWVNERRHQWRSAEAGGRWNYCQVYREPSWHANKPDPGPGWRLLGRFPDEELKPGDEYFDMLTGRWRLSLTAKMQKQQPKETWYRRRIEPVEPEPQHYILRVGDSANIPNGQTITITAKGFEVVQ
jgi:hypothetical protein